MHQHSFSQGLSSFFQRLPHRFGADALHYLAFNQPVRQQFKRPTYPAQWRFGAGQGNQAGFPLTVQLLLTAIELLPASQGRLHTLLHTAAAYPFHRRPANLEGPGDIPVLHHPVPLRLIAQQQNASMGLPVGRRPPSRHHCLQFLPLLHTQFDPVLLLHHSLPAPYSLAPLIHLIIHQFKAVGLLAWVHKCRQSPQIRRCLARSATWRA